MVEIKQIQFRRDQLGKQLQEIGFQISKLSQQLEAFKVQEIATKGAIAGLDEILIDPVRYGNPESVIDKQVPPHADVASA